MEKHKMDTAVTKKKNQTDSGYSLEAFQILTYLRHDLKEITEFGHHISVIKKQLLILHDLTGVNGCFFSC